MASDLVERVRRTLLGIASSVLMVEPDCQADSSADISQYIRKKEEQQLTVSKQTMKSGMRQRGGLTSYN